MWSTETTSDPIMLHSTTSFLLPIYSHQTRVPLTPHGILIVLTALLSSTSTITFCILGFRLLSWLSLSFQAWAGCVLQSRHRALYLLRSRWSISIPSLVLSPRQYHTPGIPGYISSELDVRPNPDRKLMWMLVFISDRRRHERVKVIPQRWVDESRV